MKKGLIAAAILAVIGFGMMATKSSSNNLEAKRRGEEPLSDAEAQNYLNSYSDLLPYYNSHPHLAQEYGSAIQWAKHHWANYGRFEGRTFESKSLVY